MKNHQTDLRVVNRDILKYLAIIPMTIGHFCSYLAGETLYGDMPLIVFVMMHLALFAPPIFFFCITEGFRYTRSRKKYALRLLLFAVITQIPFVLANEGTLLTWAFFRPLNIIFTLLIGLLALMVSESGLKKWLKILLIILLDAATVLLFSEWMIFGIPMMLALYHLKEQPKKRFFVFAGILLAMQTVSGILSFSGWGWTSAVFALQTLACLAAYFVIDKCYNGEKGKHPTVTKWFFYAFYPAHLLAIYIVKLLGNF